MEKSILKKTASAAMAALVLCAGVLSPQQAAAQEDKDENGWSGHYGGSSTICSELDISSYEYYKWLVNHDGTLDNDIDNSEDNRDYYIGTPYVGYDHRNPKGDCEGAYGVRDEPGVAAMNCTGFVWHVLMNAALNSGKTLDWAQENIPTMGDYYNGKFTNRFQWVSGFVTRYPETEYYYYGPNKYKSVVEAADAAVADGVLEYGDVIFLATTFDAHVGIYCGDGTNNQWWDSSSDNLGCNEWGDKIDLRYGLFKYLYIIKAGASDSLTLNVSLSSAADYAVNMPELNYSFKGISFDVFTDENCTQHFGVINTDDSGTGSYGGLRSGASGGFAGGGTPVHDGDYWLRLRSENDYYSLSDNVMKFSAKELLGEESRQLFPDGGEITAVPNILLNIDVSDKENSDADNGEFSPGGSVYRICRKIPGEKNTVGYVRVDDSGESCEYFYSEDSLSDFENAPWISGSIKVPYCLQDDTGDLISCAYLAEEVVGCSGRKPTVYPVSFSERGSGAFGDSRLLKLTARIKKECYEAFETLVFGDIDRDGIISSVDAVFALRASLGIDVPDEFRIYLGDVDADGVFTSVDALEIMRCSVGLYTAGKVGTAASEEEFNSQKQNNSPGNKQENKQDNTENQNNNAAETPDAPMPAGSAGQVE